MDGWGSLTMLIKRQEAAKNRKAKLKFDLQKRKESAKELILKVAQMDYSEEEVLEMFRTSQNATA